MFIKQTLAPEKWCGLEELEYALEVTSAVTEEKRKVVPSEYKFIKVNIVL